MGYFSQHQVDDLDLTISAFVHIQRLDETKTEKQIRTYLGGFAFKGDKVKDPIRLFSGGEKARLAFAIISYQKPNILLMDEPTNHMDMEAIDALNQALMQYDGTLIFVSHDREFVSTLATRVMEIKDKEVIDFQGTYDEYLSKKELQSKAA